MGRRRNRTQRARRWWAGLTATVLTVAMALLWFESSGHSPGAENDQHISAATDRAVVAPAIPTASASASKASPSASASPGRSAASSRPSTSKAARPKATTTATKSAAGAAGTRTFAFANRLGQTVWLAATKGDKHPLATTGWVLRPGGSVSVTVPEGWGGRFWGRTGCSFDAAGQGHCQTGDCAGGFQCAGSGATPATLAEFALGAWGGMDFYDVSMVDGSNLPMYINITHGTTKDPVSTAGCSAAGCTKPVTCPSAMQTKAGGRVVACKNPCAAFGGDTYCCRGAWAGRENCVPSRWPVDYTQVFKKAEPYAYSYAFDDAATMSCRGGCDYRVTFGVSGG
ncbi:thaumatin family protein [Streptomyces sp.]